MSVFAEYPSFVEMSTVKTPMPFEVSSSRTKQSSSSFVLAVVITAIHPFIVLYILLFSEYRSFLNSVEQSDVVAEQEQRGIGNARLLVLNALP